MSRREIYVKPVVMQLHYSTDRSVTIAQTCKTTTSSSGPAVGACQAELGGPCSNIVDS
jgi:hypothetical protein